MKSSEKEMKGIREAERLTRRIQHGVEIMERETIRTISVNADANEQITAHKSPRLVIGDTTSMPSVIITKSRSQLREIDAFLQSIVRRPLGLK